MKNAKTLSKGLHAVGMVAIIFALSAMGIFLIPNAAVAAPVLSVIKTVDKPLANPSDTLSYTVTVSNSGNTPATYVELVDTLPAGLTFADTSFIDTTINTWDLVTLDKSGGENDSVTKTYDVKIVQLVLAPI
jgi:uncharacterized repeat protein (TIGR01451 family)